MTPEREKIIFDDFKNAGDDIPYCKRLILQEIYKDPDIFEVLNNTELIKAGAAPEDYYNKNIFSRLKIPDSQSEVKNFICFEVNDVEEIYHNPGKIRKRVIFRTVSHQDDVITKYGIDRQDLLGFLIKERFNWSGVIGMSLQKIYDTGKVSENGYYYRDIYFEQTRANLAQSGTTNTYDRG